MSLENLITKTRSQFPRYQHAAVEITPLEKGGSDRSYYRVAMTAESSLVLVKYDPLKVENARFVAIARFLEGLGVNAPYVYHHDPLEGLIWMQDLGERDLWHHRDDPWPVRQQLYQEALDQVLALHRTPAAASASIGMLAPFDEALYRWEQRYACENCFALYFQVPSGRLEQIFAEPALGRLAVDLAARSQELIHRDFQSQNILVWQEQVYLIDFQGMRVGTSAYDVASLLYDPYVHLSREERENLLAYYHEQSGMTMSLDEYRDWFQRGAVQRLLQALGAYGVIGLRRQKPEFLRHIRPALRSLCEVASQLEGFYFLSDFLVELPDRPQP
ncbi:MAG TPA: phosphotransferase [Chthoniobacterales bacterium]